MRDSITEINKRKSLLSSLSQVSTAFQRTVNMGELKEEIIRNRLVVSIQDSVLSERLQMDETLMLDKAKRLVRQRKAVKEHRNQLKQGEETSMDYVQSYTRNRPRPSHQQAKCTQCGRGPPPIRTVQLRELYVIHAARKGTLGQCAFPKLSPWSHRKNQSQQRHPTWMPLRIQPTRRKPSHGMCNSR